MRVALALALGPFALRGTWRKTFALIVAAIAAVLTQLGAPFVWITAGALANERRGGRRWLIVATATLAYVVSSIWVFPLVARLDGRVALPCYRSNPTLVPYSILYCLANRHYVTPELAAALSTIEQQLGDRLQGRQVLYLDAGFPIGRGFPMLPHLSHGDGRRIDLAFLYRDESGRAVGFNGSPIGYFAFVPPLAGRRDPCPPRFPTLRWDLDWLQPLLDKPSLDVAATRVLLNTLIGERRIGKVFIEPHLRARLGIAHPKLRFQGCHAARHDDHVHLQL